MNQLSKDAQRCKRQESGPEAKAGLQNQQRPPLQPPQPRGICEQAGSAPERTFISPSSRPWLPSGCWTPAVCLSPQQLDRPWPTFGDPGPPCTGSSLPRLTARLGVCVFVLAIPASHAACNSFWFHNQRGHREKRKVTVAWPGNVNCL